MGVNIGIIERVASQSLDVRINRDKIREYCVDLSKHDFKHWSEFSPIQLNDLGLDDEQKMAFLFVFNTLSFSYWGKEKWKVDYEGKDNSRATWSMQLALKRAIDEGIEILDPKFLAWISRDDLGYVLRGNVEIPMLGVRTTDLNQLGITIQEDFDGSFQSFIDYENNALRLLDQIVDKLNYFSDFASYQGEMVNFHKKAQLLVSDINHFFYQDEPLHDDWKLTGCADYILPMVLRHYGILEYSTELAEIVDEGIELQEGMPLETQIRANTVWAVELMKNELQRKRELLMITPMMVNDHLWMKADYVPQEVEYHKTRTINY